MKFRFLLIMDWLSETSPICELEMKFSFAYEKIYWVFGLLELIIELKLFNENYANFNIVLKTALN